MWEAKHSQMESTPVMTCLYIPLSKATSTYDIASAFLKFFFYLLKEALCAKLQWLSLMLKSR